ncbi:MAG: hypothetical protein WCJ35_22890 [Planctomycetota bacterium]
MVKKLSLAGMGGMGGWGHGGQSADEPADAPADEPLSPSAQSIAVPPEAERPTLESDFGLTPQQVSDQQKYATNLFRLAEGRPWAGVPASSMWDKTGWDTQQPPRVPDPQYRHRMDEIHAIANRIGNFQSAKVKREKGSGRHPLVYTLGPNHAHFLTGLSEKGEAAIPSPYDRTSRYVHPRIGVSRPVNPDRPKKEKARTLEPAQKPSRGVPVEVYPHPADAGFREHLASSRQANPEVREKALAMFDHLLAGQPIPHGDRNLMRRASNALMGAANDYAPQIRESRYWIDRLNDLWTKLRPSSLGHVISSGVKQEGELNRRPGQIGVTTTRRVVPKGPFGGMSNVTLSPGHTILAELRARKSNMPPKIV